MHEVFGKIAAAARHDEVIGRQSLEFGSVTERRRREYRSAVLFRERLGRLLGAEHVRDALGLEVGERDGSQVL